MVHDRAPFVAVSSDLAMASYGNQMGNLVGDRVLQKVVPVISGNIQIEPQLGCAAAVPYSLPSGSTSEIEAQPRLRITRTLSGA